MGLYKRCPHRGRARDRCEHAWWGSFRGRRVSLEQWIGRDIRSKAEAAAALDELRSAIRAGAFDPRVGSGNSGHLFPEILATSSS